MGHEPQGMEKVREMYHKEVLVSYIPKSNVRRCLSELFASEEEYDAWFLLHQTNIFKIASIRTKETQVEYYAPKEDSL